MKLPARSILLSLACLTGLAPATGAACAIVPQEEAAQRQQRAAAEAKKSALALMVEADLVFIGRMAQLTFYQETLDMPARAPQVLQVHQARFDQVDNIKGHYPDGQMVGYTVDKSRVTVGCGAPEFRQSLPKENGSGERYLIYVRDGTILRANPLAGDAQALTGAEEAAILRAPK